jgi:hypothetical protein
MLFIDNFWNKKNLAKPTLVCLHQDQYLYNLLLYQCVSELGYDNTGIWTTSDEFNEKIESFVQNALANDIHVAMTPEYSFPWSAVNGCVQKKLFPAMGNVWLFGCQSITPKAFLDLVNATKDVEWVFDEELLAPHAENEKSFLDPVCIFLRTNDLGGNEKLVIIVQFKTACFGGADSKWERDNLIRGTKFYVLSNEFESSRLVVLLCSDSLLDPDFYNAQNGFFLNVPLLIVHLQLNQKPFQLKYKNYRSNLFSHGGKSSNKEIICLNWARGVRVVGQENAWNSYGGSAFYLKSEKVELTDTRLNHNHKHGLYYSNWIERRAHVYFLNYDEHVFKIRSTKPSQELADPTQMNRSGPEMVTLFSWLDKTWQQVAEADAGFASICDSLKEAGNLSCLRDNKDYLDVERIVELTLGNLAKNEWYKPTGLSSFKLTDAEFNSRVTFTQDPDEVSAEVRQSQLIKYAQFKNSVLKNTEVLPDFLKEPELRFDEVVSTPDRFLVNLHSANGSKGTGVFLGTSIPSFARKKRLLIETLFKNTQQGKRVAVWYNHDNETKVDFDLSEKPMINENIQKGLIDINKTRNNVVGDN